MELQSYLDKVRVTLDTGDDDDFDLDDADEADGTEPAEADVVNTIICPSCGEDLSITDDEELFEGAEIICESCGAQIEVTGFDKSTPILKQIEEQK